jgi:osmotically-inducible protein OsmY
MRINLPSPRVWVLAILATPIIGVPLAVHAQDQANPPSSAAPDNSTQNKSHATTADDEKGNSADRAITQKIRQSIVKDKSLSTYAHNVKIITQAGRVTLKGPVQNDTERQTVASKAADVAGGDKVNNQLTVMQ